MDPQHYAERTAYRPPTTCSQRLTPLAAGLVRLGLAPRDAVVLEVRGRTSGKRRRTPVVLTRYRGCDYLVSLSGDSQWVRNVRAAAGDASLHRRGERRVRLVELDEAERGAVIAAYLRRATRGGRPNPTTAERYFGLGPTPSADEVAAIASYYPVFRVDDRSSPSRST